MVQEEKNRNPNCCSSSFGGGRFRELCIRVQNYKDHFGTRCSWNSSRRRILLMAFQLPSDLRGGNGGAIAKAETSGATGKQWMRMSAIGVGSPTRWLAKDQRCVLHIEPGAPNESEKFSDEAQHAEEKISATLTRRFTRRMKNNT